MNLFDELVAEALKNQPNLSSLKIVVEKELLHHDILRIMNENNLFSKLTFIGGTCLRCCYGGLRLSEDLDFTGGSDFNRESLTHMSQLLITNLYNKYGLNVSVSEPIKDIKNVATWKIKIETRPGQKHLPAQRINIDICNVQSYEKQPMLLLNPYGVDMGTSGLIIQAQSREEIYADKLLAFALRPNRIKYRDIWDIVWLHQQAIKPRFELVLNKLNERNCKGDYFLTLFSGRTKFLIENKKTEIEFQQEMQRFLSGDQINQIINQNRLWDFVIYLIQDLQKQLKNKI